jgi:hypothetical protein
LFGIVLIAKIVREIFFGNFTALNVMEKVINGIKNVVLVFISLIVGGSLNMAMIMFSSKIIPLPHGVDVTTEAGLKAGMHLFEAKHFIMPFLAHALGTLLSAIIIVKIMPKRKQFWAYFVAAMFFAGGFMEVLSLPSPLWFSLTDLIVAYFPMSFIALKLFYRSNEN